MGSVRNPVEREVEDVEIAQPIGFGPVLIPWGQRPREDEGHALFAEAAMRAQAMAGKPGEIVVGA